MPPPIDLFRRCRVSCLLNSCIVGTATLLLLYLIVNTYLEFQRNNEESDSINPNSRHFRANLSFQNVLVQSKRPNPLPIWSDAPDLTIICRAYSGSVMEFYNIFLVGYHLFWPHGQWPNSDVVVVLDEESELDHRLGTVLVNLPPYPKVYFEKIPQGEVFCSEDRRLGYSRQQYSNFYSDLYTDKEYIGIVDSDSMFVTHIIPENLFVDKKPRILG